MPEEMHSVDLSKIYMNTTQILRIVDFPTQGGWILDIGGGGEGIIEQMKGNRVIAIDKNARELSETKNDSLKIVMDATDLKFLDNTFEVVTLFFTLMYIPINDHLRVFQEVARVLEPRGHCYVWDMSMYLLEDPSRLYLGMGLKIILPNETVVETGYASKPRVQTNYMIKSTAELAGLTLQDKHEEGNIFMLHFRKDVN